MPKLYELTAAYNHITALIDDDATANDELLVYFNEIEGELQDKATNIAKLIENLEATAENIKAAEGRMAGRRKALENRADSIRKYLLTNMVNSNIFKIECDYFKIAVRDNPPAVIVDDESAVPSEYFRTPEPPKPTIDKKKILADIKEGVVISGVHLEQSKRLSIS